MYAHDDRVEPVEFIRAGAERYSRDNGLVLPTLDFHDVVALPARGRAIALAYMAAPSFDPAAVACWEALWEETARQFDFLTRPVCCGGLGVSVEIWPDNPYGDVRAMTRDLRENRRLRVYATGGPGNDHPLLSNRQNDVFRAVHDAFGHAAAGRGFSRHGEEAAWLKHSFMYSPLARQALTTEFRGQNSVLNYYYEGARFGEQKVVVLPEGFRDLTQVTLART